MSDYNGSLQRFRQTVLFRRIEFWFDTEVFEDILMGNGECVSSDQTGPVPVDPFYIIFTLHTLLQEDRLSNEMINTVFRKIHITRNNICIFLDYVYRFIDYKKKATPAVLDLDINNILRRIHNLHGLYSDQVCFQNFWRFIWDELVDERLREALGVDPALREIDSRP